VCAERVRHDRGVVRSYVRVFVGSYGVHAHARDQTSRRTAPIKRSRSGSARHHSRGRTLEHDDPHAVHVTTVESSRALGVRVSHSERDASVPHGWSHRWQVLRTRVRYCRHAGVAKLADARDLKSRAPQGACGFDSHPRHDRDCSRVADRSRTGPACDPNYPTTNSTNRRTCELTKPLRCASLLQSLSPPSCYAWS
jgi:hypothetical protein